MTTTEPHSVTPFDSGLVLQPKPWPQPAFDFITAEVLPDFGKVDFNGPTGVTEAVIRVTSSREARVIVNISSMVPTEDVAVVLNGKIIQPLQIDEEMVKLAFKDRAEVYPLLARIAELTGVTNPFKDDE